MGHPPIPSHGGGYGRPQSLAHIYLGMWRLQKVCLVFPGELRHGMISIDGDRTPRYALLYNYERLRVAASSAGVRRKCAGFAGILRAGRRQQLECPPDGIVGEKVYIRDDRRQGTLSLCEVEVKAQAGNTKHSV